MTKQWLLIVALLSLTACHAGHRDGLDAQKEINKAQVLISQGHYTEAYLRLNQVLASVPKDPSVHLNLGWLYLYTEDYPNVERQLNIVEELAPKSAEFYHLRGSLASAKVRKLLISSKEAKADAPQIQAYQESAIKDLQQALKLNPKNPMLYFDLATDFSMQKRYQDSVDLLDKGFDMIPQQDLETQVNFEIASCSAQAKMQNFQDAIAECEQAEKFATTPATKERVQEMIEEMKLLNP